jgi:eukaryotic-like serine/threonine-protein kinase
MNASFRRIAAILVIIAVIYLAILVIAKGLFSLTDVASITTILTVPPAVVSAWVAWAAYRREKVSASTRLSRDQVERNRSVMLERIRILWIKGVFDRSLHNAALIALRLNELPSLVQNPFTLHELTRDGQERALPANTRITDVFDESGGELLILGEPGSGKTTLLLELTRDLLARAENDKARPMPMVFNLSTWVVKRLPFDEWLIEELSLKYLVPRKLAQSWVENDQILPLLDGLDEVALTYRRACVDAINRYRHVYGLTAIVICSRIAEYLDQTAKLLLQNAVVIQPLTMQQVDDYLSSAGDQLSSLRALVHSDETLQEVVTNPLMLSILTLAYRNGSMDSISPTVSHSIRRDLLSEYISRMFGRHRAHAKFPRDQAVRWLTWLATQLQIHHQSELRLERIQLDWLPQRWRSHLYPSVGVGVIIGFFGWLIYGIFFGTHFGLTFGIADGFYVGCWAMVVYSIVNGWLGGKLDKLVRGPTRDSAWRDRFGSIGARIVTSLAAYGIFFGITIGPLVGFIMGAHYGTRAGVAYGFYNAAILSIDFVLLGRLGKEIRLAEMVRWSSISAKRAVVKLGPIAAVIGFGSSLFFKPDVGAAMAPLLALIFGLTNVGIVALLGGLTHYALDNKRFENPNEGVWRSARYGVLFGIVGGCTVGLTIGLTLGLLVSPAVGIATGLSNAISAGEIIGLRIGGFAWLHHMTIRLILWRSRCIPWDYLRFLDYAVDLVLLQRVGGGYAFPHRVLLEHFASVESRVAE